MNRLFEKIVNKIDNLILRIICRNRSWSILLNPIYPTMSGRLRILKARGAKVGDRVFMDFNVWVEGGLPQYVEIHDCVILAAYSKIIAHDSALNNMFDVPIKVKKTVLKGNCYIGTGAIIMPGVTVGEKSIVGAGAVVTKDIPPYSVAVGNPAKVIMSTNDLIDKYMIDRIKNPGNYISQDSIYRLKVEQSEEVEK